MKNKDLVDKQTYIFIEMLKDLEPIELFGVSKILCIKTMNEDKSARTGGEILGDMIETFNGLNRKQKKEILKILKEVKKSNALTKN